MTEADILAASQPLKVPGVGEQRVLAPAAVERLAAQVQWPRWQVEAAALDVGVIPLHYLRTLGRLQPRELARLLRSSVALVGRGPVIAGAAELLASAGIGRLSVLCPAQGPEEESAARAEAGAIAGRARNENGSCETRAEVISTRAGNPAAALQGADVLAACLHDAVDEQLLQFACRIAGLPLVLAGAEDNRGQLTVIFPGGPGVALLYKPAHPHLSSRRDPEHVQRQASLMVGHWISEQVAGVLLAREGVLRDRLLYADLDSGEIREYPLL